MEKYRDNNNEGNSNLDVYVTMWDIGRNKNDTKSTSNRGDEILIDMKTKVIQNHAISTNKRKDQMCIMKNNMIII